MNPTSTGKSLTAVEQERIRLNAARFTATALAKLMGRDYSTVEAWARLNGVTIKRPRRYPRREAGTRVRRMAELSFRRKI